MHEVSEGAPPPLVQRQQQIWARPSIPEALTDVALIDAETSAAVGGMKVSWWALEVREGRAPAPVIREVRCTRWLLTDVRAFWAKRIADAKDQAEHQRACAVARGRKASFAAQAKRTARTQVAAQ